MKHTLLLLLLASTMAPPASAQRDTTFFSCPDTSVFGSGCAADQSVWPSSSPVPVQEAYPLFAPETLARDTPPIFVRALEDPTPANIDRYLDWQEERLARMSEVQQLLKERYRLRQGRPATGKEPAP